MSNLLKQFIADDSGQGITEYGALLAFVGMFIVAVAGFVSGAFPTALSQCYSLINNTLNTLTAQATP